MCARSRVCKNRKGKPTQATPELRVVCICVYVLKSTRKTLRVGQCMRCRTDVCMCVYIYICVCVCMCVCASVQRA